MNVWQTGPNVAPPTFEDLLAEAGAVPLEGWDFSWFDGRATEERPPWGYAQMMADRMASATAALDIGTGGGEVLATVPHRPPLLVATESWPPNRKRARENLQPLGVSVVAVADDTDLPLAPRPSISSSAATRSTSTGPTSPGSSDRAGPIWPSTSGPARPAT